MLARSALHYFMHKGCGWVAWYGARQSQVLYQATRPQPECNKNVRRFVPTLSDLWFRGCVKTYCMNNIECSVLQYCMLHDYLIYSMGGAFDAPTHLSVNVITVSTPSYNYCILTSILYPQSLIITLSSLPYCIYTSILTLLIYSP